MSLTLQLLIDYLCERDGALSARLLDVADGLLASGELAEADEADLAETRLHLLTWHESGSPRTVH